jgi:para-nitrobenzyl esterase
MTSHVQPQLSPVPLVRGADLVVRTATGAVRGARRDDVLTWRGVPYAAPPVGGARWAPPRPAEPWGGVLDAREYSPRAPQVVPTVLVPPSLRQPTDACERQSEDCLYLNVCAPARPVEGGAPVLVWIHGGGFHFSSGPDMIGDGAVLAREGIVVVTFNYRLGALGFLQLRSALGPSFASSGNCGLMDQMAALRWIQDNIAGFGGDPSRVTIAGNSAGAKSVANLMASEAATGLFAGAISSSGGDHVLDLDGAAGLCAQLLGRLDLPRLTPERLRAVPAEDVLAAQHELAAGVRATWLWRPVVDGRLLRTRPTSALSAGSASGIPLLAGANQGEAVGYDDADPSAAELAPVVLDEVFSGRAREVLAEYARAFPSASPRDLRRTVMGDERYCAPTLRLVDAQSAHADVWRYDLATVDPTDRAPARHGADVPLVWDIGLEEASPQTRALALGVRGAWSSFIRCSRPTLGGTSWPAYRAQDPRTMVIDFPSRARSGLTPVEQLWRDHEWTPGPWWPVGMGPSTAPRGSAEPVARSATMGFGMW